MLTKPIRRILFASAALLLLLLGARFRLVIVSGASMMPALSDRQIAVLEKTRDRRTPPRRGDIVVFRHGSENYVKRVYAVPGDTVHLVRFANGATCLAGEPIFPWDKVRRLARSHPQAVRLCDLQVPNGSVFVLGDNSLASYDSRVFGAVRMDAILGRVLTPRQAIASLPATIASEFGRLT